MIYTINVGIFILIQLYSLLFILINVFVQKDHIIFIERALKIQLSELYTYIFPKCLQNKQKLIENNSCLSPYDINLSNKELIQYINILNLKLQDLLNKKVDLFAESDPFIDYLKKLKIIDIFCSKKRLYYQHLKMIIFKYHYLIKIINGTNARVSDLTITFQSILYYFILQLLFICLADNLVKEDQEILNNQTDSNNFNSTIGNIVLCILGNQLIISPISILFAKSSFIISSRCSQFYSYLSKIYAVNQSYLNTMFVSNQKCANIIKNSFKLINLFILIASSFQFGKYYQFDKINSLNYKIYIHFGIILFEMLIGRIISCIFIWFILILKTSHKDLVFETLIYYLQIFYEEKSLMIKQDNTLYDHSIVEAEYKSYIDENQDKSPKQSNFASILSLSQQPQIEKFNTVSTLNKRQAFQSGLNQTISTQGRKNFSRPSIYQLRQLSTDLKNKTLTEYENTFPLIMETIKSDSQRDIENIHNTTVTDFGESFIKEEETIPTKQIKNFQKNCCDLLNKNNITQTASESMCRKANSVYTDNRGSFDFSLSMNILPLQDIEIHGLQKKSSNILPFIQSSYLEGVTQQNNLSQIGNSPRGSRNSYQNQYSVHNHSFYSNASNTKSFVNRNSLVLSSKPIKSQIGSQNSSNKIFKSNTGTLTKYSSQKSSNSLNKFSPQVFRLNEHQLHFDQKGNLSSNESRRKLSDNIKINIPDQLNMFNQFMDNHSYQQTLNIEENKNKMLIDQNYVQSTKQVFNYYTSTAGNIQQLPKNIKDIKDFKIEQTDYSKIKKLKQDSTKKEQLFRSNSS